MLKITKSECALRRIKNRHKNGLNGVFVIRGTRSNDLGGNFLDFKLWSSNPTPYIFSSARELYRVFVLFLAHFELL